MVGQLIRPFGSPDGDPVEFLNRSFKGLVKEPVFWRTSSRILVHCRIEGHQSFTQILRQSLQQEGWSFQARGQARATQRSGREGPGQIKRDLDGDTVIVGTRGKVIGER